MIVGKRVLTMLQNGQTSDILTTQCRRMVYTHPYPPIALRSISRDAPFRGRLQTGCLSVDFCKFVNRSSLVRFSRRLQSLPLHCLPLLNPLSARRQRPSDRFLLPNVHGLSSACERANFIFKRGWPCLAYWDSGHARRAPHASFPQSLNRSDTKYVSARY
jgi:hypothetical protein